ncbi:MAG: hypothetical protein ABIN91_19660 [Mucilaginibacter sp.]|uniref:hypothetical protein n=1 Tax=Mucilaginibacter sp. TaxID=1882438 RepID=UPI003266B86A
MKKLLFAALFLSAFAFKPAQAQISISLGLNIGSQPDWGPVGYDHAEYYYMPDIDMYYDVPNRQYIYLNGRTWTRTSVLPARYANYDLYHGYKVVVNEPKPYLRAATYRAKYARYKNVRTQTVIRDSRDVKYTRYQKTRPVYRPQPGRPQPGRPQNNGHDNGHGNGHDNGHGRDDHRPGRN